MLGTLLFTFPAGHTLCRQFFVYIPMEPESSVNLLDLPGEDLLILVLLVFCHLNVFRTSFSVATSVAKVIQVTSFFLTPPV